METHCDRTRLLLGEEAQDRLRKAHVVVVGLGAVGGFALEMLARAGIGRLTLVDFDRFEKSNLNRQILATSESLGRPKTEVAADRAHLIAPKAQTEIRTLFFSKETADEVLLPQPDAVIDAIDSAEAKADLIEECVRRRIPIFSSMGAAQRTDADAVRTGNLFQTQMCPLAKKMRLLLRQRGIQTPIFCVYSLQPPIKPAESEAAATEPGSRRPLGSLATLTAIFGARLAHEVILRISENRL